MHFKTDYHKAKNEFREKFSEIQKLWKDATFKSIEIKDGLTLDLITAQGNKERKNLLVLMSGVHGIEGYIGDALISHFLSDIKKYIDPDHTGISVVHTVNPWGMKNFERNNENNVDLNRNFVDSFDDDLKNQSYEKLREFLQPKTPLDFSLGENLRFFTKLAKILITDGSETLKKATLKGQYTNPDGLYYGGDSYQKSAIELQKIFANILGFNYRNILLVDIHSGYGKRFEMTVVNSPLDKNNVNVLKKSVGYSNFTEIGGDDFYQINGDCLDYFYRQAQNFDGNFFGTCFEFGTMGDSLLHQIDSLKTTILANQAKTFGFKNKKSEDRLKEKYLELFYPHSDDWKQKAVQDFDQALTGLINHFFKE